MIRTTVAILSFTFEMQGLGSGNFHIGDANIDKEARASFSHFCAHTVFILALQSPVLLSCILTA